MKLIDDDDFTALRSLDCFEELMFYGWVDQNGNPATPFYYGYQLHTWVWKKPYESDDVFFKRWYLSLFPKRKVKIKTPYIFMIRKPDVYYWCTTQKQHRGLGIVNPGFAPVGFEEVFESMPEDIKEKLIYHINIFRV